MSSIDELLKLAASAKGIPDRGYFGNVAKNIKPGDLVDYMRQKHEAYRRGPHYDVRFGKDKSTGLHSWATSFDYPEPGGKIGLIQQPTHSFDYLGWSGDIPKGQYGGGKVSVADQGKILITDIKPDEIHFTIASDKSQKRYAMIKGEDKQWVMVRASNPDVHDVAKPKLKAVTRTEIADYLKGLSDEAIAQPKVDGALNFLKLQRKPELLSHRTSKVTGTPIVHTERFFQDRPKMEIPTGWKNSTLLTEIYGERKGQVIPVQALSGILNSTIENALDKQKSEKINLKAMLFDVAKKDGKIIDRTKVPYAERRQMLEEIIKYLPKDKFILPEQVSGKKAISDLLSKIRNGKHPLTREGLVVHDKEKQPVKLKLMDEQDVYIRDTVPGAGKYKGYGVGGFKYSFEPNGPIVGNVGTGLSDELRREMYLHPDEYLGRIARVHSQGTFTGSQALRTPALLALHEG